MNMKVLSQTLKLFVFAFLVFTTAQAQAQYLPVGPQTDVPVSTVVDGGWEECYRDIYSNDVIIDEVLSECSGEQLMLACRELDSETLTLLAQGMRSDVLFDTGDDNENVTHIANGVGWYFNDTGNEEDAGDAWGFVRAGDSVSKNNCDTDDSGANDERLCWHLQSDTGGYRCGVMEDLNNGDRGSESYERIVYVLQDVPPPPTTQIPTLSQWGLIAMAGFMGVIAFMMLRRKTVA